MTTSIVMIHGMWGGPWCWDNYRAFFEQQGVRCHTPELRHHDVSPLDTPSAGLGRVSLRDYVDDLESYLRNMDEAPVIMGHSMGGLLTQMLGARGWGKGLVLLTPASPAGINALTYSVVRSFWSILTRWGFWRRPQRMSFKAASYAMMNCLSLAQRRSEFARLVFDSGRAVAEIGFWPLDMRGATRVDADRVTCPMLVVGAAEDRLTPAAVARKIARKYAHVSTYREMAGHGHWIIGEPGWEDIAASIHQWLVDNVW